MANRKNIVAQAQDDNKKMAKKASKLTLASLKKRGVELTSLQLHLAVLYSRVNSLSWGILKGTITPAQATAEADKAYNDFVELESRQQEEELEGF